MQVVALENILPATNLKETSPKFFTNEGISFEVALKEVKKELESEDSKRVEKEKSNLGKDEKSKKESDFSLKENETPQVNPVAVQENSQKIEEQLAVEDFKDLKVENSKILSQKNAKDDIELSAKQFLWLENTSLTDFEQNEISSEDFSSMIDSVIDFIPHEADSKELLETAQEVSVANPSMFLQNSEKNIENLAIDFDELNLENKNLQLTKKSEDKEKIEPLKEHKKDLKIDVTDLRTQNKIKIEESQNLKVNSKKDYNLSYKREGEKDFQVSLDLSALSKQNITSSDSQTASATSSNFQNMISNAVQENALDFVKAGNIILKDNNQGNINLILHPEKLGNVKISLNLSEKMISASITVHSQEAYEAMKESLESLKNAFASNGFQTGEFNLNFSNQNSQFAQGGYGHGQEDSQSSFRANATYGEYVAEKGVVETSSEVSYTGGAKYSVNIVA
ncbi:flagellar hook-length control protein FliK [Treponema pectinovorum]|uniref:flagellar hook-length control protein FliK n=1 Tax=Treponema pectinovorum TaxID=164 RepID=UPI003D8C0083